MVLNSYRKTALATVISASVLTLSACGGGSDGGDDGITDSGSNGNTQTSTFNFSVESPNTSLANLKESNSIIEAVQMLAALIVPSAHAIDDDLQEEIQVALVDAKGVILKLITPIAISRVNNGSYSLVLDGGERIDCVIVVDVSNQADLKVGDTLDPEKSVFTPAVEANEPIRIDLASSIAYKQFLQTVDNFDGISVKDLDSIIENMQKTIADAGLTASTIEELIEAVIKEAGSQVETETKFAAISVDVLDQVSSGNYDTDKAVIKAFFDDVNTLAYLGGGFIDNEEPNALDDLSFKIQMASDAISTAQTTIDSLTSLTDTVCLYRDQNLITVTSDVQTLTVAEIFANDPKGTNLTGTVSFSEESLQLTLNGTYNTGLATISVSNMAVTAAAQKSVNDVSISLSGMVESAEAKLVISQGLVTANGIELNDLASSELQAEVDKYFEGLQQAEITLSVELTAKNVEGKDAVFLGDLVAGVVRSSNDFVEYDTADETAPAEAYYNLKFAKVTGSFEYDGESFSANVELSSSNADNFVPDALSLLPSYDVAFTDIASYKYNGESSLEIQTIGDTDRLITANTELVDVAFLAGSYVNKYSYQASSFSDAISKLEIECSGSDGRYTFSGSDLSQGAGVVSAALSYAHSEPAALSESVKYSYSADELYFRCGYNYEYYRFNAEDTLANNDGFIYIDSQSISKFNNVASINDVVGPDVYFYNEDYSIGGSYQIDTSALIPGVDQPIVATLSYDYNYGQPAPATLNFTYSYGDATYILKHGERVLSDYRVLAFKQEDQLMLSRFTADNGKDFELDYSWSLDSENITSLDAYLQKYDYTRTYIETEVAAVGKFQGKVKPLVISDEFIAMDMYLVDVESGVETSNSYRELDAKMTLVTELAGLGETTVTASLERTDYDSGIISLTFENIDASNLSADVSISAMVKDAELADYVITNDNGFAFKGSYIEDKDAEAIEIKFGLATAIVELTNLGLKVSYPDPDGGDTLYDLY